MNDKLIFRAAAAYHEMLIKIAAANMSNPNFSRHACNVKNIMAEISVWSKRLEVAQTKGWENATSFLKHTMIKRLMQNAANTFSVMESELLEENEVSVPSIKELWQEIKSLNGLFEGCDFRNNRLSVTTQPITLEHNDITLNLGRFEITIDFKADITGSYEHTVLMRALEPAPAPAEEDLVHPHIRNDEPCLGEAVGLMQKPFVQGRIESVFLILNGMLNTYNPGSPYCTIEKWYDEESECSSCGGSMIEDDVYSCSGCSASMCSDCMVFCCRCDQYYCENCTGFVCGWCEESVCGECDFNKCKDCNMPLCKKCVNSCCESYCEDCNPMCVTCTSSFCPSCEGGECTVCDKQYCGNCPLSCEECNVEMCKDCSNECVECSDAICPECTRDCENCGKNFCKNCIDEDECSLLKEKV